MKMTECKLCGEKHECKVQTVLPEKPYFYCPHEKLITEKGDETFIGRTGCLDCNKWLNEVKLRKP